MNSRSIQRSVEKRVAIAIARALVYAMEIDAAEAAAETAPTPRRFLVTNEGVCFEENPDLAGAEPWEIRDDCPCEDCSMQRFVMGN